MIIFVRAGRSKLLLSRFYELGYSSPISLEITTAGIQSDEVIWRGVWLLLICSFQSFFLFRSQHHSGFLQLVLGLGAGALAVVNANGWGLTGLAVADRAVPPFHVG